MSKRVLIAIPLPPTSRWRLVHDSDALPPGYVGIGTLTVGAAERAVLEMQSSERRPLARPAPAPSPTLTRLCPDCPLRAQLPEIASDSSAAPGGAP